MATIEVRGLAKRFGQVVAVDGMSFDVLPGRVTGFLGPNGAGKTTTLRMILGLVRPTAGSALIDGRPYRQLSHPARTVGAVLEASGFHPGRTARNHLRVVACTAGLPSHRAEEVLAMVGLTEVADRTAGACSLGMRQRLELASAMLGDPQVLVLDEPANGLDPQGISWLRGFLRWYAAQGKAVLVSSHLLAEMGQTVDDVVIVASGRIVVQAPLAEVTRHLSPSVRLRSPEAPRLAAVAAAAGIRVRWQAADLLLAEDTSPEVLGPLLAAHQIVLHAMEPIGGTLEDAFLALTAPVAASGPASVPGAP